MMCRMYDEIDHHATERIYPQIFTDANPDITITVFFQYRYIGDLFITAPR